MGLRGYFDLDAWKKAMELSDEVSRLIEKLPKKERNGLIDQMGRCAASVPSNISEGYGRKGTKDYIQFLGYACGSNFELQTQLNICVQRGYFTEQEIRKAMNLSVSTHILVTKLIESLERKLEREKAAEEEKKRQRAAEAEMKKEEAKRKKRKKDSEAC